MPRVPFYRIPAHIQEALRPLAQLAHDAHLRLDQHRELAARYRALHEAAVEAVLRSEFPDPRARAGKILDLDTYTLFDETEPDAPE